jgi:uncharacterized protein YndB with AHSA1/START domain
MKEIKNEPVVKEILLNASVSRVWKAITDKDDMKQWYFDLSGFRPEVGFEFHFTGEGLKGERYIHICKVTEVIPEKKVSYSWKYEGYTGISFITFELFEERIKTRVRLTHEGLESFETDNPDFAKENFIAGWNEIIGTSLKKFIEESEK